MITNIVPGRLWAVDQLLSPELASTIQHIDWLSLATQQVPQQHFWRRDQVAWDEPAIKTIGQAISNCLPEINSAIGTDYQQASGHFWIDHPGFECAMHTDGELHNSMQLYWLAAGSDYGTGFYEYKRGGLIHQFKSVPNTGYIMLNNPNPDGSQPLQWHAMLRPVPSGTIRVSSYWQFR